MNAPEDTACEKYFTPPGTLTDMLRADMCMEPDCDADAIAIEDTLNVIKSTVKSWLRNVAVGPETPERADMRKMLIMLVDEP